MYLAPLAGGTGRDDAVAGAASTVLEYFFPDEASNIDKLADELADPSSSAFRRGIGVGRLLIARAERDGSDAVWTGTPPKGDAFGVRLPRERLSAARAARGRVADLEPRGGITVSPRSTAGVREQRLPGGGERSVRDFTKLDRRAEADR
jgi:hypothetical protein